MLVAVVASISSRTLGFVQTPARISPCAITQRLGRLRKHPLKAPQSHLTAVDSAPVIPEPVEASQEPHPTQADIEPGAEKNDIESQVLSIQSLISTLLKRS